MPEDLTTPEKNIQQVEKEQLARLKAKAKAGKLMLDEKLQAGTEGRVSDGQKIVMCIRFQKKQMEYY